MKQLPIQENTKIGITNDMIGGERIGNIRIMATYTGEGVVQNDPFDNYVAARKDSRGRLMVSTYKVLRSMRSDERPSANPKHFAPMVPLANIPPELVSEQIKVMASIDFLAHGYMEMMAGSNTYTKQKTFSMSNLVQSNDNKTVKVVQVATGPRTSALKDELAKTGGVMITAKGETAASANFATRDVVSETRYENTVTFAIPDVAFISCDDMHGRCSIYPEYIKQYCAELEKTLGSPVQCGYYRKKNCPDIFGEYGVLLTDEQIAVILNYILARLQRVHIKNSSAYVEYSSATVELYGASIAKRDVKARMEFNAYDEFFIQPGTQFETGYVPVTDAEDLIAKRRAYLDGAMAANAAKLAAKAEKAEKEKEAKEAEK